VQDIRAAAGQAVVVAVQDHKAIMLELILVGKAAWVV
jgi:hypothetical protein